MHFGEVALSEVLDLGGFNLNAKLDIDPDFLKKTEHDHHHGHDHDHEHGEACNHASHGHAHHHHHDDDVKSFVFKSERAFDPAKLEDFLGAIVNITARACCATKACCMKGTDRKGHFRACTS